MRADLPPVIAVLPLANLSGDATRDYVAAGIADSLITSLAAVPSVTVLSRAAVAEARGRAPDLAALFGELDADFMVEGSVQQVGQRLQVSLSLFALVIERSPGALLSKALSTRFSNCRPG